MARNRISDLNDELLVKILSFLPTKVAVSTSILSKRWKFLWMWLPNLKFDNIDKDSERDFINKNLPLHRAPIIKNLSLRNGYRSGEVGNLESWVDIAVSRSVRELSIHCYLPFDEEENVFLVLPSSLYTCNSLVTLKIHGRRILVDVPRMVCLPSLKTLELEDVIYSNEDSLRLLLSYCPVLEDLTIERDMEDNVRALVIIIPFLQRLSLITNSACSSDWYVIVTPSLKYFRVQDSRLDSYPYLIEHMPELEKADIHVLENNQIDIEKLFKSIATVKHLTLRVLFNSENKTGYCDGIVFSQLENLKLYIHNNNWSKILFQLLKDSPNLQTLDIETDDFDDSDEYIPDNWSYSQSSVPECLLKSLKTFKFEGSSGKQEEQEERDFLSFIIKHACCLKSISINTWK